MDVWIAGWMALFFFIIFVHYSMRLHKLTKLCIPRLNRLRPLCTLCITAQLSTYTHHCVIAFETKANRHTMNGANAVFDSLCTFRCKIGKRENEFRLFAAVSLFEREKDETIKTERNGSNTAASATRFRCGNTKSG